MSPVSILRRARAVFGDCLLCYQRLECLLDYHQQREHGQHNNKVPSLVAYHVASIVLIASRCLLETILLFLPSDYNLLFFNMATVYSLSAAHNRLLHFTLFVCLLMHWLLYPLLRYNRHYRALLMVKGLLLGAQHRTSNQQSKTARRIRKLLAWAQHFSDATFWIIVSSFFFSIYLVLGIHLADEELLTLRMLAKLIFIECNAVYCYLVWAFMALACRDTWLFMTVFSLVVFDRFDRCQRCYIPTARTLTIREANNFMHRHNDTFQAVMSLNRVFSWLLLLLFGFSYPVNAYVTIDTLMRPTDWHTVALNVVIIINEYYFIILLHLMALMHSTRIHRFTKAMLGHCCRLTWPVIGARLRLAHYIEKFHVKTNKRFGMSYGPFGLITFTAFSKIIFVYIRFLFSFYTKYKTKTV